jgi:phosphate transport system substrate-binding protein
MILVILLTLVILPAQSSGQSSPAPIEGDGPILVAGSATLGPVVEAAAEAFVAGGATALVEVERSSSGAGLERFCAGDVDIATSGRTIRDEEAEACASAGIEPLEFEVAFDGVAVVVNPANEAVSCVTVDQLRRMWEPGSDVDNWADVESTWPDGPLTLYGMGEESGTYQFFTQVVVGEEGVSRDDYQVTEGHPQTAEGVANDASGLGFLPFPRYLENQESLKLLEVDAGNGCVAPDGQTIQDGTYAPLSRPMYVYVNVDSLSSDDVRAFLTSWFGDAATIAQDGGLVPSSPAVYEDNLSALEAALDGGGTPEASPVT